MSIYELNNPYPEDEIGYKQWLDSHTRSRACGECERAMEFRLCFGDSHWVCLSCGHTKKCLLPLISG